MFSQDEKKDYIPNVTFNFGGGYPFIPSSVKCEFELLKDGSSAASDEFYFDTLSAAQGTIGTNNMSYSILAENILNKGTNVKSQL